MSEHDPKEKADEEKADKSFAEDSVDNRGECFGEFLCDDEWYPDFII